MSDTRYPTRMHEVLGVETGRVFYFEGTSGLCQEYVLDAKGHLFRNHKTRRIESPRTMADIINHPERITRRPRLTQEQVEQLKAAHQAFEFNWLAKHKSGLVAAFKRKPVKGNNGCWFVDALAIGYDFGLVVREGSLICSLVSWSDPEPLDIVAALKAAGVEVEG